MGELFTFQPSEIAKVAVVVYFSNSISKKKDKMYTTRYGIVPYLIIMGVIALFMLMEPHLSGTVLILGTGAVLMLVGGINLGWVIAAVGGAAGVAALMFSGIITYGPVPLPCGTIRGWMPRRRLPAGAKSVSIGSGGLLGVGLGKSRQKYLYLPEEHNDFIFAIVCEELGLIGATIIMLLFAALILRGYWIALHARDRFGSLLVVGVTTLIALQTFLNIGVVTGLLPTTRNFPPVFQLWRHGPFHAAGGNGNRPIGIATNETHKGGVGDERNGTAPAARDFYLRRDGGACQPGHRAGTADA